jgi:hypothetical protein
MQRTGPDSLWAATHSSTRAGARATRGSGAFAGSPSDTGTFNSGFGNQAMANISSGSVNTGMGGQSLLVNASGSSNTAVGYQALSQNTSGSGNTSIGSQSGQNNLTGTNNTFIGAGASAYSDLLSNATAIGANAIVSASNALVLGTPGTNVGIGTSTPYQPLVIQADDNGVARDAAQQLVIQGNTNPNLQLLIGYRTSGATSINNVVVEGGEATIQATWNGNENTGLLLQPNGGCVCIGTGTGEFLEPLVIGQGQGTAVADGWQTYSSRRFKTNIHTLPDALAKVEKLRGVSYDLKATGKHEIGVIAEEVGAVVPEVVTWEPNGKDAHSVDYARLTALLIEAAKQQQAEIAAQSAQLAKAIRQIKAQQTLIGKQANSIKALAEQVSSASDSLRLVKRELASGQSGPGQPTPISSR